MFKKMLLGICLGSLVCLRLSAMQEDGYDEDAALQQALAASVLMAREQHAGDEILPVAFTIQELEQTPTQPDYTVRRTVAAGILLAGIGYYLWCWFKKDA